MNNLLSCPADCDTDLLLPAITEEQDCTNYEQYNSQISDLYIIPNAASDIFASWSSTPTLVSGAIDNANTDNTKAKWVVGIGNVPPPEKETTPYPKKKSKVSNRIFTLELRVPNMTTAQREFLRKFQCGWTGFTFYYADLSGFVYGKAGGLAPKEIDVDFPAEGDNASKQYAIVRLVWEADADPERRTNPHAS